MVEKKLISTPGISEAPSGQISPNAFWTQIGFFKKSCVFWEMGSVHTEVRNDFACTRMHT